MSDHLPECPIRQGEEPCVCPELRACEARVRGEALAEFVGYFSERDYTAGAQAARDAVAASDAPCSGLCECVPHALAAIDALRGDA